MPTIIRFERTLSVSLMDSESYINDCCVGGDLVLDQLLPPLRKRYGMDIHANQEDWGWFAWFKASGIDLAVDIFTTDPSRSAFEVHLTSRRPRMLFGPKVEDTPELAELATLILAALETWPVDALRIEHARE